MAKILVTGASGFIGFHLTRALLDQGHEISCLVRKSSKLDRLAGLPIRRADGDVTDAESLRRVVPGHDAVYHLAGLVKAIHVPQLYQVNREGVANVAQACAAQTTPPVLLVVSSLAAMGPSSPHGPGWKRDPPTPVSHYGRSKLAGEQAARQWAKEVADHDPSSADRVWRGRSGHLRDLPADRPLRGSCRSLLAAAVGFPDPRRRPPAGDDSCLATRETHPLRSGRPDRRCARLLFCPSRTGRDICRDGTYDGCSPGPTTNLRGPAGAVLGVDHRPDRHGFFATSRPGVVL